MRGDERGQRGHGELGEAEQADAGDLAGQQVAGGHAGQQHLDDPAGLLLHDAGQDQVPVGDDGHEQQHAHDRGGRLVVGAAPGGQAELDVLDGHRGDQGEQLVGIDPGGRRPLLDGDQLDGAGDDGAELLVGLAPPLQLLRVDHEHVDVLVADGLLPGGDVVVAVHAHGDVDGVALVGDGAQAARLGTAPVKPTSLATAPVSSIAGHGDHGDDDEQHDHQPGAEASRAAALAQLPEGDQPSLPQAVHAATAWRNSSDSVGGW